MDGVRELVGFANEILGEHSNYEANDKNNYGYDGFCLEKKR